MSSSTAALSAPAQEADTRSNKNDLIIDEGFPVLNTFRRPKPGDKSNELAKEQDPVPRYPFATFPSALLIDDDQMENITHDCDLAFTARTKEDSAAYSSGATYFMPASMKPRCALEELAMSIFTSHTEGLEAGKHYDAERSGAEWWTLVMDTVSKKSNTDDNDDDDANSQSSEEDDEVGMHFDADYGLEAQLPNFMLHPRVATITYLSNVGVPTLILNKRSPPPTDVEKKSLNGSIEQGWLSCPIIGKHICFDGRLLHGAPGAFFPSFNTVIEKNTNGDVEEQSSKRRKLESGEKLDTDSSIHDCDSGKKRITFMVNVWLNHCPIDAELIDDDLCTQMKTLWECNEKIGDGGAKLKGDANYKPPLCWSLNDVSKSSHRVIKEEIKLCDELDWAGTEECVLCNREVDVNYCATMKELHSTAQKASNAEGKSIEISFEAKVLSLEVGAEVEESDSEEEDGEEE